MDNFWQRAMIESGEIKDGETRYVVFRADVIASMVNSLPDAVKQQVLESFHRAVKTNGGRSLKNYLAMVGNDNSALLDTVAATASSLGWGEWHFDYTEDHLMLEVTNSPFAAFAGDTSSTCCAPILGMFSAVADTLFANTAVTALETSCAGHGGDRCRFEVAIIR